MVTASSEEGQPAGASPFRARNVRVLFYIQTVALVIWSFSFGAMFDAYLLELARGLGRSNPNAFVGSVESVRGMTSLVLAFPLGVLSDKVNRRKLLRWCSGCGTAGVVLLVLGIASDLPWVIYFGVVVAAIFMQIFQTCGQALIADSVPKDQLTAVMTWQSSLFLLAYSVGPLVQAVLIACVGNTWDLRELHIFLCAGFALWPIAVPGFFLFEPTVTEREAELSTGLTSSTESAPDILSQEPVANGMSLACQAEEHWSEQRVLGMKKKWLVPVLIELTTFVTAIGAGMTVKFFPLFFKEDYGFQPIALCGLNASYTVAIAVFVQICRTLSTRIGRCQAAITWHLLGTFCLFLLWKVEPLPLVVAVYILRGSFMNAMAPMNSAIVMECVDSKLRGRWSALQSISRFTWSGSAIFGGWLADAHDYRYTFYFTGLIYATSALIYTPLLFLVPAQVPSRASAGPAPARTISMQTVRSAP